MLKNEEKAIMWLELFDFLTINKKQKILSMFDEPYDIFSKFVKNSQEMLNIVTQSQLDNMLDMLDEKYVDRFVKILADTNVKFTTCYSSDYPQKLLDYNNYPLVLYYKGDLSLINNVCVGVVGTRRITRYGERVTQKYCEQFVANNITIVSGMAEGVDTISAKTALNNGGKTIAVLGSGFNDIYPHSNIELSKQIAKNGLLITEYSPTMKAATYHFPVRNRIIVALSDAVLITEASLKSGVMYTKDYCLEYGKDIFVVPGNIDSERSEGCNAILKAMQGAITTSPNDILESLNIKNSYKEKKQPLVQVSLEEKLILDALSNEEVHFDELLIRTKLDTKTLLRLLTTMELNGIIKKLAGNYYSK